jgi:hypothetical protein
MSFYVQLVGPSGAIFYAAYTKDFHKADSKPVTSMRERAIPFATYEAAEAYAKRYDGLGYLVEVRDTQQDEDGV